MNSFVAKEIGDCWFVTCSFWTGGYKTHDRDGVSWRWWSDQTQGTMSYTSWDWLAGEPDGENKKDMLVEEDIEDRIAISSTGKWYDRSGIEEHSFVCTKKANLGEVLKLNIIK